MRFIFAALLFLAPSVHGDTGKGLYWNSLCSTENSYADGSGFSNPVSSGQTLTFDGVLYQEGSYSARGFAGCCNTMYTVDPSTWASNTSVTAQCYFRISSTAATAAVFGYANLALSQWNGWIIRTDGGIDFYYYGNITHSAASLVSANTWYFMAAHWGSDGNKFFLTASPQSQSNPGGTAISNTPVLTASGAGVFSAHPNAMQIGRYSPSGSPACSNCYIDSMRLSVGDMPTLPSTDMHVPTATNTPTNTPTNTITPSATPTSTITQTSTSSPTRTSTFTVTPTFTVTNTPYPTPCNSPIVLVSYQALTSTSTTTAFTFTFATDSSPNSILIIGGRQRPSIAATLSASWGGASATLITSAAAVASLGTYQVGFAWAITNPALSTSAPVVVTSNIAGAGTSIFAAQYSNVDSYTPLGAWTSLTGTTNPIYSSITTQAPNSMVVGLASSVSLSPGPTPVYDSGQNTRWTTAISTGSSSLVQYFDKQEQGATSYVISSTVQAGGADTFSWLQLLWELEPLNCITPTPSATPSSTPTATPSPTSTRTITPSATPTATGTITRSPTFTQTPTWSPSPTATPTTTAVCGTSGDSVPESYGVYGIPMLAGNRYSLTAGRVNYVAVYMNAPGSQLQAALYADSAGRPGSKVCSTSTSTAVTGWNYLTVGSGTIAAGNYWILAQASNLTSRVWGRPGEDLFVQRTPTAMGSPPTTVSGIVYPNKYTYAISVQVCSY